MALSASDQIGTLARDLKQTLAGVDVTSVEPPVRRLVAGVSRDLTDVRLDIRDFEFADSLADQQKAGRSAVRRFEKLHKAILALSEHGLLGAADVAEYSSRLEALTGVFRDG